MTKEKNLLHGNVKIKDQVRKNFELQTPPAEETMIITRTNSKLIDNALSCIEKSIPYHIIGGANDELFSTLYSINSLVTKNGELIKNETVRYFHENGWGLAQLKKYAEDYEDLEIMTAIPIYNKHAKDLEAKIKKIKAHHQRKNKVKLWLSTAHKAKGLEAQTVVLGEDYRTFKEKEKIDPGEFPLQERNSQEINLLYVAATRAKKCLYINKELTKFLVKDRDCLRPKGGPSSRIEVPDGLQEFINELTIEAMQQVLPNLIEALVAN